MGNVVLIKPNGEVSVETIDFEAGTTNANNQIRAIIGEGCSYYEMTPSLFLNHHFKTDQYPSEVGKYGYALLIDEEGKLKKKPFNEYATIICANPYDAIVGNAIIVAITKDPVALEYDFCGLPDSTVEYLKELFKVEE